VRGTAHDGGTSNEGFRIMAKRTAKILLAGVASVGGAIAGAALHQGYRWHRGEHLRVTLYSEPR
jgi:hypothetical protein